MGEFREVCDEELLLLKSALDRYMPVSSQMMNIVRLKSQGRIRSPTLVNLFLYDDGQENPWLDPFVVSFQHNIHSLHLIVMRPPTSPTFAMMEALDIFLDWDKIHMFSAIPQTFLDNNLRSLFQKRRSEEDWEEHPCEAFILEPSLAMTYPKEYGYTDNTFGDSVEVHSLQEEDVDQVLRNYDWTKDHSKIQTLRTIQNSASCGVYVKRTPDEKASLASFALLSPVGLLNILYTEVEYRRRGFGVQVLRSLGSRVVEMGFTPRAEFEIWNDASRLVQSKAGFTFVDKVNWVVFKPRN